MGIGGRHAHPSIRCLARAPAVSLMGAEGRRALPSIRRLEPAPAVPLMGTRTRPPARARRGGGGRRPLGLPMVGARPQVKTDCSRCAALFALLAGPCSSGVHAASRVCSRRARTGPCFSGGAAASHPPCSLSLVDGASLFRRKCFEKPLEPLFSPMRRRGGDDRLKAGLILGAVAPPERPRTDLPGPERGR